MSQLWTEDRVERLEPYLAAALDESLGYAARCAPTRRRVLEASMQRLVDTNGQFGFRPQTLLRALELSVVDSLEAAGR